MLYEQTKDDGVLLDTRNRCYSQIEGLRKERKVKVREIFEGEDVIAEMRHTEQQQYQRDQQNKEDNNDYIEELDKQLVMLDKKIINKEKWIGE